MLTRCAELSILIVEGYTSDASDETPPGILPLSGKRLAPSKEAFITPADETLEDRELSSRLSPPKAGDLLPILAAVQQQVLIFR